ncbi:hypothetical protein ACJ73_04234 [Blastomyces percursus]|uniref:Catalase core domain-containing protein n=1 Tax=Blastomyces percursus TaxID=1658174 RepID=A0A1J9R7D2_9EURO|nr:hypothetical protein ACJ73_04234 [Blastomyces percursus]
MELLTVGEISMGQRHFTWDEAVRMSGADPDYSKRDLWSAIEKGEQVSWTAHVQIMKPEEADLVKLGDVEQAAFSPGSMVPRIEDSPDPLLQFRMFFYRDAQ